MVVPLKASPEPLVQVLGSVFPLPFIFMPQPKTHQVVGHLLTSFLYCSSAAVSQPQEGLPDGDPGT